MPFLNVIHRGSFKGLSGFPLTLDWVNRARVNGSAVTTHHSTIPAMMTFEATLAANGFTSRIYHMNFMHPIDFPATRTPFIKTYGSDPWVRLNVGTGGPGEGLTLTGWTPNPNGDRNNCQIYDIGVIPNNVTQWTNTNGGASCYISGFNGNPDTTNLIQNGVLGTYDGTNYFDLRPDLFGFNTYYGFIFEATTGASSGSDHGGGFHLMARIGTNEVTYQARSNLTYTQRGNVNVTGTGKPTSTCCAGGDHYPSNAHNGSAVQYSYFGWHDGFTLNEGKALFNAVQALRTSWGGGYL